MNIIFLDVDGVLNSRQKLIEVYNKTKKPHHGYSYPFDEKCLNNLKILVEETHSKLVITSIWRKDEEGRNILLNTFKKYNLDNEVIGFTPILNTKRGYEIKAYLNSLEYTPNFVILDDDSDMNDLSPYLVKTNLDVGLTYKDIEKAINILNNKNSKQYKITKSSNY